MKRVRHIYLSYSSYNAYQACPRRFAWSRYEQLSLCGETQDETTQGHFKGSLVHSAINDVYTDRDWLEHFESSIPVGSAMDLLKDSQSGSRHHIRELIKSYLKHYNLPNESDYHVHHIEKSYEMPINEFITFVGDIDKEVITENQDLAIVDHKTSSGMRQYLWPTIDLNDQFTGYIGLLQASGKDVNKVIIDGISTTLTDFKAGTCFERRTTHRTKEQVEEFRQRVEFFGMRLIQDIENQTFVSHQPSACFAYNKPCQFIDACKVAGSARLNVLRNNYEKNTELNREFRVVFE